MASPARQFRVGGSKYTVFYWQGNPIAFANQVSHISPQPVAQAVAIQPIDAPRPLEIVTPAATGIGTLVLQIFEVWGEKVWDRLAGIAGANDLVSVFNAVAASPDPIKVSKHITPPAGSKVEPYFEIYNNAVIANVEDGEVIEIGTMQVMKNITINYAGVSVKGRSGT